MHYCSNADGILPGPVALLISSERSTYLSSFGVISISLIEVHVISTDEDPSLRIESFAMINLGGVSTKLYFNLIFTMQTARILPWRVEP